MLAKELLFAIALAAGIFSLLAISISHPLRKSVSIAIFPPKQDVQPDDATLIIKPAPLPKPAPAPAPAAPPRPPPRPEPSPSNSRYAPTTPRVLEPGEKPPVKEWCGKDENGGLLDISCMLSEEDHTAVFENAHMEYHEIFSNMSKDGHFWLMDFGHDHNTYNPNIIPHPRLDDTWILVAHRDKSDDWTNNFKVELTCNAQFVNNTMKCEKSPLNLPILSTVSKHCKDTYSFFNAMIGPHDARVFHGLDRPYVLYGSPGKYTCLTQHLQDLRRVVDWDIGEMNTTDPFFWSTELQRPKPYNAIEKNWFVFWDAKGQMYVHHTLNAKKRVFAKLNVDGSVGADLAPKAAKKDEKCMARWMPKMKTNKEWIHQSTNTLLITMCERADPSCERTEENTFIFFIFQVKTFYMHGNYEPYVMMMRQTAPFEIHGISDKPFWVAGRELANGTFVAGSNMPKDQNMFLFMVSFSWKSKENTYHGYLDDTLFLSFGVEDSHSGMIDVVAKDLLANIALCGDVPDDIPAGKKR